MALLEVTDLGISFGGLRAVDELNMHIDEGALVGLIGPNGAGKTTVFNMLTGVYRPTDGGIRLAGENIVGKKPHEICKMGIARTFQNIRLFNKLSVLDNVKAAMHDGMHYNLLESVLKTRRFWLEEENADSRALELLAVLADGREQRRVNVSVDDHGKTSFWSLCQRVHTLTVGKIQIPENGVPGRIELMHTSIRPEYFARRQSLAQVGKTIQSPAA